MKKNSMNRIIQMTLTTALAFSLLGFNACSNKKDGASTNDQNSNVGAAGADAKLQCGEGEFSDAAGQSKKGLKLQTSLYYAIQDQWTASTLLSAQDVAVKDGQIYYARSTPVGIGVAVGNTAPTLLKTLTPTLSSSNRFTLGGTSTVSKLPSACLMFRIRLA